MNENDSLWPENPYIPRTPAPVDDPALLEVQEALRPLLPLLSGYSFSHATCLVDEELIEERRADFTFGPGHVPVSVGVRPGTVVVVVHAGDVPVEADGLVTLLHLNHGRAWKFRLDSIHTRDGERWATIMLEMWAHGAALAALPDLVLDGLMQRGLYEALFNEMRGNHRDHLA